MQNKLKNNRHFLVLALSMLLCWPVCLSEAHYIYYLIPKYVNSKENHFDSGVIHFIFEDFTSRWV